MIANMDARLLLDRKETFPDGTISETVIWLLPAPVPGSHHNYKYRFFFGLPGRRLIGYDNERGKGDHRHVEEAEEPYRFTDPAELIRDYWDAVERWRVAHPNLGGLGRT
jgi:hypothetical protein